MLDLNGVRMRNRVVTSASLLGYGAKPESRFFPYGMSPVAQFLPLERFGAVTSRPVLTLRMRTAGDTAIAGVPGRGAAIVLDFSATGGTLGRGLLPTGAPRERLDVADGDAVTVSIVDAAAPSVFVAVQELGLDAHRFIGQPLEPAAVERLLAIRAATAERLGLVADRDAAAAETPAIPKVYAVQERIDYVDSLGRPVRGEDTTLCGRGLSMGRPHGAYATTVGVATAVAARIPGTVVAEL